MTWEKITHDLARAAGISVPDSELLSGSTTSSSAVAPRYERHRAARNPNRPAR